MGSKAWITTLKFRSSIRSAKESGGLFYCWEKVLVYEISFNSALLEEVTDYRVDQICKLLFQFLVIIDENGYTKPIEETTTKRYKGVSLIYHNIDILHFFEKKTKL